MNLAIANTMRVRGLILAALVPILALGGCGSGRDTQFAEQVAAAQVAAERAEAAQHAAEKAARIATSASKGQTSTVAEEEPGKLASNQDPESPSFDNIFAIPTPAAAPAARPQAAQANN